MINEHFKEDLINRKYGVYCPILKKWPNIKCYNKTMKKSIYLFILFITVGVNKLTAQKVFSAAYQNQANVKVFVVDYENQADLKVYKVPYQNQISKNEGKWYFTQYSNQADKIIYFVKYSNQADLKIFFVKYTNQAGWINKSKIHLLY